VASFNTNAHRYLATASADHTVKLWNTKKFKVSKVLEGHQRWVWDCVFSADSAYLVTGSSDQVAKLWDVAQGETIRQYTGHHKAITCIALNDFAESHS
jgi:G protein beta subunit-like protein